jgi:protein-S-isoprenylcysteine O-methyltransferase Ste14
MLLRHLASIIALPVTVLVGLGFILLYSTISLFIKKGDGTISPWNPAKKLIVTGVYAHVRNPMLIGVFLEKAN